MAARQSSKTITMVPEWKSLHRIRSGKAGARRSVNSGFKWIGRPRPRT